MSIEIKGMKIPATTYKLFAQALDDCGGKFTSPATINGNTATVNFVVDNYTQFMRYWHLINNDSNSPQPWYKTLWNKITQQ